MSPPLKTGRVGLEAEAPGGRSGKVMGRVRRSGPGRVLSGSLLVFWLWVLALATLAAEPEVAARATAILNKVEAISADGVARRLARGDLIYVGETLTTGPKGRAQLRFTDRGVMTLRPATRLSIDDYRYDPAAPALNRQNLSVDLGGFRAATGAVADSNREGYRVASPLGVVGVRGTNYEAVLTPSNNLVLGAYEGTIDVTSPTGNVAVLGEGADFNFARVDSSGGVEYLLEPPEELASSAGVTDDQEEAEESEEEAEESEESEESEEAEEDSESTEDEGDSGEEEADEGEAADEESADASEDGEAEDSAESEETDGSSAEESEEAAAEESDEGAGESGEAEESGADGSGSDEGGAAEADAEAEGGGDADGAAEPADSGDGEAAPPETSDASDSDGAPAETADSSGDSKAEAESAPAASDSADAEPAAVAETSEAPAATTEDSSAGAPEAASTEAAAPEPAPAETTAEVAAVETSSTEANASAPVSSTESASVTATTTTVAAEPAAPALDAGGDLGGLDAGLTATTETTVTVASPTPSAATSTTPDASTLASATVDPASRGALPPDQDEPDQAGSIENLIDTDGDGIGDAADLDDDGDGIPDLEDAFPLDPAESADLDRDGVGDNADAFPGDPSESRDTDGDGVGDGKDLDPLDPLITLDTDGDGIDDSVDAFPNDPNESLDSDGDGVGDNADDAPLDSAIQVDSDNDGVDDSVDADPNDPSIGLTTPVFSTAQRAQIVNGNRVAVVASALGVKSGISGDVSNASPVFAGKDQSSGFTSLADRAAALDGSTFLLSQESGAAAVDITPMGIDGSFLPGFNWSRLEGPVTVFRSPLDDSDSLSVSEPILVASGIPSEIATLSGERSAMTFGRVLALGGDSFASLAGRPKAFSALSTGASVTEIFGGASVDLATGSLQGALEVILQDTSASPIHGEFPRYLTKYSSTLEEGLFTSVSLDSLEFIAGGTELSALANGFSPADLIDDLTGSTEGDLSGFVTGTEGQFQQLAFGFRTGARSDVSVEGLALFESQAVTTGELAALADRDTAVASVSLFGFSNSLGSIEITSTSSPSVTTSGPTQSTPLGGYTLDFQGRSLSIPNQPLSAFAFEPLSGSLVEFYGSGFSSTSSTQEPLNLLLRPLAAEAPTNLGQAFLYSSASSQFAELYVRESGALLIELQDVIRSLTLVGPAFPANQMRATGRFIANDLSFDVFGNGLNTLMGSSGGAISFNTAFDVNTGFGLLYGGVMRLFTDPSDVGSIEDDREQIFVSFKGTLEHGVPMSNGAPRLIAKVDSSSGLGAVVKNAKGEFLGLPVSALSTLASASGFDRSLSGLFQSADDFTLVMAGSLSDLGSDSNSSFQELFFTVGAALEAVDLSATPAALDSLSAAQAPWAAVGAICCGPEDNDTFVGLSPAGGTGSPEPVLGLFGNLTAEVEILGPGPGLFPSGAPNFLFRRAGALLDGPGPVSVSATGEALRPVWWNGNATGSPPLLTSLDGTIQEPSLGAIDAVDQDFSRMITSALFQRGERVFPAVLSPASEASQVAGFFSGSEFGASGSSLGYRISPELGLDSEGAAQAMSFAYAADSGELVVTAGRLTLDQPVFLSGSSTLAPEGQAFLELAFSGRVGADGFARFTIDDAVSLGPLFADFGYVSAANSSIEGFLSPDPSLAGAYVFAGAYSLVADDGSVLHQGVINIPNIPSARAALPGIVTQLAAAPARTTLLTSFPTIERDPSTFEFSLLQAPPGVAGVLLGPGSRIGDGGATLTFAQDSRADIVGLANPLVPVSAAASLSPESFQGPQSIIVKSGDGDLFESSSYARFDADSSGSFDVSWGAWGVSGTGDGPSITLNAAQSFDLNEGAIFASVNPTPASQMPRSGTFSFSSALQGVPEVLVAWRGEGTGQGLSTSASGIFDFAMDVDFGTGQITVGSLDIALEAPNYNLSQSPSDPSLAGQIRWDSSFSGRVRGNVAELSIDTLSVKYYEGGSPSSQVILDPRLNRSSMGGLFVGSSAQGFVGAFNFEAEITSNSFVSPGAPTGYESVNGVFLVPSQPVTVSPVQ